MPLQASININLFTFKTHIVSQISQLHEITQKWFFIQNLRMDLCFQEEKQFVNPWHGSQFTRVLVILENFFIHPVAMSAWCELLQLSEDEY